MSEEDNKNDYNSEPVIYCAKCYSLKIRHDDTFDEDYCVDCGCTDVSEASIEEWESLYQGRYGSKFAKKNCKTEETSIYKMTTYDLKVYVSNNPEWKNIIRALYPGFPIGFSKSETILMFFDKLATDNRITELKIILANKFKNNKREEK